MTYKAAETLCTKHSEDCLSNPRCVVCLYFDLFEAVACEARDCGCSKRILALAAEWEKS